jgi:hypothetical protein
LSVNAYSLSANDTHSLGLICCLGGHLDRPIYFGHTRAT